MPCVYLHTCTVYNAQLKDLKRQLHQMQKKEEKRQEQLAEFAAGGQGTVGWS